MKRHLIGACAATLMFALPAAADPVTVTSQQIRNSGRDGTRSSNNYYHYGVGDWTNTFGNGHASSQTSYSQTIAADSAQFDWTFTNTLTSGVSHGSYYHINHYHYYNAFAQSYGVLNFNVSESSTYEFDLSGLYEGVGDHSRFYAYTRLLGPSGEILYDYEFANTTPNAPEAEFDVDGEVGSGNYGNARGAVSGTLEAGNYSLVFQRYVMDVYRNGLAAEGAGNLSLSINSLNPVPEPGTWALLGLGGLALLLRRRK